jgi:hypothetical protein
MAKVDAAVVDEAPPEEISEATPETEEKEGKKTRHREKWTGGYSEIFDDAESAKHKPPLKEDGSEAVDENGDDIFAIYKIEVKDDEDKLVLHTHYTWARNNTESLVNFIDATQNIDCSKLDGKRGRQKMFKPEPGMVQLITSMKERNDTAGMTQFLTLFPMYQYIIDGTPAPEFVS